VLDFLYIAVVAVPLVLASGGLLLLAVRAVMAHNDERDARRAGEVAVAEANPGALRRRAAPLQAPPSVASLEGADLAELGRAIADPIDAEISELAASLAFPPRDPELSDRAEPEPRAADVARYFAEARAAEPDTPAWLEKPPPPREDAPGGAAVPREEAAPPRAPLAAAPPVSPSASASPAGRATKACPDCAEEVLAAARVCKHCRYRWDEPEAGLGRASVSV